MDVRAGGPSALLVRPDYGCCIWWLEPEENDPTGLGAGGVHPEDLGLPDDLIRDFHRWMERFESMFPGDPPAPDRQDLDREGRELATRLKRYYGERVRIEYRCEREREVIELGPG